MSSGVGCAALSSVIKGEWVYSQLLLNMGLLEQNQIYPVFSVIKYGFDLIPGLIKYSMGLLAQNIKYG